MPVSTADQLRGCLLVGCPVVRLTGAGLTGIADVQGCSGPGLVAVLRDADEKGSFLCRETAFFMVLCCMMVPMDALFWGWMGKIRVQVAQMRVFVVQKGFHI